MTYIFNAQKLIALRQEKFWTQEDLAAASGVSVRTIQRMERGKSGSIESWKALAAAFDVDINHLRDKAADSSAPDKESNKISVGTLLAYAGGILGCGFGWGALFRATPDFHGAVNDHTLLTSYVTVMTALCLMAPFIKHKFPLR